MASIDASMDASVEADKARWQRKLDLAERERVLVAQRDRAFRRRRADRLARRRAEIQQQVDAAITTRRTAFGAIASHGARFNAAALQPAPPPAIAADATTTTVAARAELRGSNGNSRSERRREAQRRARAARPDVSSMKTLPPHVRVPLNGFPSEATPAPVSTRQAGLRSESGLQQAGLLQAQVLGCRDILHLPGLARLVGGKEVDDDDRVTVRVQLRPTGFAGATAATTWTSLVSDGDASWASLDAPTGGLACFLFPGVLRGQKPTLAARVSASQLAVCVWLTAVLTVALRGCVWLCAGCM